MSNLNIFLIVKCKLTRKCFFTYSIECQTFLLRTLLELNIFLIVEYKLTRKNVFYVWCRMSIIFTLNIKVCVKMFDIDFYRQVNVFARIFYIEYFFRCCKNV
ncbi:hypothetical protein HanPSC8_Chr03g0101091 [Helianthus annuus]|nr:hypothetical protein HanPSC8_Chr03g0101091 [Helianthus annuus]